MIALARIFLALKTIFDAAMPLTAADHTAGRVFQQKIQPAAARASGFSFGMVSGAKTAVQPA
jgi:hypothetical protein